VCVCMQHGGRRGGELAHIPSHNLPQPMHSVDGMIDGGADRLSGSASINLPIHSAKAPGVGTPQFPQLLLLHTASKLLLLLLLLQCCCCCCCCCLEPGDCLLLHCPASSAL